MVARIKKIKPARLFDTMADVGSLFMAVIYTLYVVLLLIFDLGTRWLNWCMLGITFIYVIFFIVKIVALNSILAKKNVQRHAKFFLRYSKWSMKIINATFVCIAIATTRNESNIIMMVGVFVVGFSFLISVLWDVAWFIISRKLSEIRINWNNLSRKDKNKRIEMIIDTLIQSLDSITGVDITESVAITAGRRIRQDQEDSEEVQKPQESLPSSKMPQ